ncbi:gamma-glutamylcyclotransferase Ecym_6222 [Eremothecium cymbalariae DBVPG|uniref:glutathione-specific gamma-glutamylcyclotransferase n=1 Tax=Eremothecium cymbalariae (strain CBS 270.75 / DBVPG 7215 / KCTC 17166 / NRRL Y-17582) TaxID=931890 RepID=G8JVC5_ERECY|nr:hypothetical protein Ecym_6222 [Eremothecium cymbalariae DBVPG\
MTQEEGIWVVGYGSLIYKPPPHSTYCIPGLIYGFKRRFWQSSSDHRGTVESPGRVATLVPDPKSKVLAVSYYIPPDFVPQVTEYLNVREQDGYKACTVLTHLHPPQDLPLLAQERLDKLPIDVSTGKHTVESVVYIGTEDNGSYIGPEPIIDTARVIATNVGPSGSNYDYLKLLHDALNRMAAAMRCKLSDIEDTYLDNLFEAVQLTT